ncbi:MAG TPA: SgcJ/EcaC family oxidoreductase [Gemmatimonadaceae bacterium]
MATQARSTDSREAIRAANARFASAFERGDAAELASCYTTDALVLPPNGDPAQGRAAIEEFWRGVIGLGLTGMSLETVELADLGEVAIEVGRYALHGEGGAVADHGKYIVVWRRTDGRWLVHRDIWNTSTPVPAT